MANFFDQFDGGDALPAEITAGGSSPFASAISSVESGGNYGAVGPETGRGRALGKYQIMTSNIGPWGREILGREVSPSEFMSNPKIQDAIFEGKFGQYVQKYGPEGASKAWFAGEKGMNNPNARDILGTTVSDYARKFSGALPQNAMAYNSEPAPQMATQAAPKANFFDQFDGSEVQPSEITNAPQPPAATPQVGMGEAIARGAGRGLSGNFYEELRGLVEAGGAGQKEPASLGKLLQGAIKYWTGDKAAEKTYEDTKAREQAITTDYETQRPISSAVGNIAGAVALPVGGMLRGGTLAARVGRGAGVGAATGAVYGAGDGEGAVDRTSRAVAGGAVGGLIGGAAPVAVEGVIRGARAVSQPIATAIRGIRNPDDEAARRVAMSVQRDVRMDPSAEARITPQEFAASVQSGGPATIMDLGGETTRALARSAANTSPEGRAVLNKSINDRFEGQTDRVTGWLRNTFNYPDAAAQQEAIDQVAKTINKAGYTKAFAQGRAGVWDNDLSEISQAPIVKEAIAAATKQAQNKSASGALNGTTASRWVNNGKPTLEFWDQVKRQLDQEINVAKRAGRNEDVKTVTEIKNTIVKKLDAAVPSYAQARSGAAHAFGAGDALEAGQKFVTNGIGAGEARKALSKMSPLERQLFQDGFVSDFTKKLGEIGDRRTVLNKIAESPAARQKLNIALGPQKAAELESGLRVEGIMDLARNAVQGNSTTARQLAELGLAGGTYTIGTGGNVLNPDPTALMSAALVYGAARGKNRVNENLARRVAEMLTSNDPAILLRGIRTVTRNQQMFNSLRAVDQRLARIGGEQSAGVPALQAAGVGRAEDQPSVPRPPGQ